MQAEDGVKCQYHHGYGTAHCCQNLWCLHLDELVGYKNDDKTHHGHSQFPLGFFHGFRVTGAGHHLETRGDDWEKLNHYPRFFNFSQSGQRRRFSVFFRRVTEYVHTKLMGERILTGINEKIQPFFKRHFIKIV